MSNFGPPSTGGATPAYSAAQNYNGVMGDDKAKLRLSEKAFPLMTAARLKARDPVGEVEGWFRRIGAML